jgi:hypothetical protein
MHRISTLKRRMETRLSGTRKKSPRNEAVRTGFVSRDRTKNEKINRAKTENWRRDLLAEKNKIHDPVETETKRGAANQ